MKAYSYQDNVFTFEGSISVQVEEQWCKPWRIDYERIGLYPHVWELAEQAAGIRITFSTDAESIGLILHKTFNNMRLDLISDGKLVEKYVCNKDNNVMFSKLSKGKKNIEIWLDTRFPFILAKVLIDDNAIIEPITSNKKRWVHYGSSISHATESDSPSTTWPGLVSRKLGLHLTSFGFGGSCVMEPMIGRMIRDTKADIITLKMGINCHDGELVKRSFESNVIGLIAIIREKHPETPLTVISPIISPVREDNRAIDISLTLNEMREALLNVVGKFRKYGDINISYLDGRELFGEGELRYMPDGLHPDAQGQYVLAEKFISNIFKNVNC